MKERAPKKITPEERLLRMLQENLSLPEKLAAARELEEEGESLDVILRIYPEYAEILKQRQAL